MEELIQEKILPLQWESHDYHGDNCYTFYDAVVTEDFGAFKKGEKFGDLTVDYYKGTIEWDNDAKVDLNRNRIQHFKCVPCEDHEQFCQT